MPSGPRGSYWPPAGASCSTNGAGSGVRTAPTVGVALDELADRALLDQPAVPDDDEVVGHQGISDSRWLLTSTVLPCRRGAEHVADPADALRVEPVGGLVEDDGVRVAEQHAGEPEPLAHAERVAA